MVILILAMILSHLKFSSERLSMFTVFFEWLMYNRLFFWLVIAILFMILEMCSPGFFFFLSFFFGALVCVGLAFFTSSLILQSVVFLISSVIVFLLLYFLVKSKMFKGNSTQTSNVYALKGRRGKVLKKISPETMGEVKIFGDIWLARDLNYGLIEKGELIEVIKVEGAHIVVKRANYVEKSK